MYDLISSEGVSKDVELGERVGGEGGEQVAGGVRRPDGAAGDVDAVDVPSQARVRHEQERQVGVRPEEEHGGGPPRHRVGHHPLRRRLRHRPVPPPPLRQEPPPHAGVRVDVQPPAAPRRDRLPVPAAAGRRRALVDEWEVAADVGAPEGAGVGDAAVAADADGDVVAAHHVEEVVEVVDGVPGVAPLVGVDGDGLRTRTRSALCTCKEEAPVSHHIDRSITQHTNATQRASTRRLILWTNGVETCR